MTSSQSPGDIRQSLEFASFMEAIGWKVRQFSGRNVFLRKFPFLGNYAKCPRPDPPLLFLGIDEFLAKNKVFHFKIAANITTDSPLLTQEREKLIKNNFRIDSDPFNPTTTILVDLKRGEDEIFKSFSEAKRRAVRRALKNSIKVELSNDIEAFIRIRKEHFFPMGFLVTSEMLALWKNFYPKKADLLLAKIGGGKFMAGILLLYHKSIAYYWFAAATKSGKKLFAPTLLVYEAIKQAKKRGCLFLDFEGIYDERFPKASESWRGFTKFKEGFSDKKIIFMENFYLGRRKTSR